MTVSVPQRSEIPAEHTWDAGVVFESHAAWEAACDTIVEHLTQMAAYAGQITTSAATLREYLHAADALSNLIDRVLVYTHLFYDVDTTNAEAGARADRANSLYARVRATLAFAEPEILTLGRATLARWCADDPQLAVYAHYFDDLERRRAYVRSADVEELLGQIVEPFRSAARIHGILTDADLRFVPATDGAGNSYEITQGTISALLTHPDRTVRRTAWEEYADAHLAARHTMAACLATGVKQNVLLARTRRYPSAIEASLAASNIPLPVFDNLIGVFRANLPTWHRYWRIRRRALGYDTLHGYDIKAPLTTTQTHVPFHQAVDWICRGMQPLGAEYVATIRDGMLEQRWVDIYPNQGKRMGAYSSGAPGTLPYIFMSYNDDIFSMSTLAHEIGHSMHSYLTWQHQPLIYTDYSLFVAEVASNFNQALVRAHLLDTASDPAFQIEVIEEAMANFHRYFFIMPILARFEREIHERVERGQALTAVTLNELMTELFAEGYGDEVVIDADRMGSTWAQFSTHLYANFYVYQYATGISAAHALAEQVLTGEAAAAERYLNFLKTGGSRYPLDALAIAGVDMLSPEPVERAFATFAALVGRLETLTM
ncbi:MAG TPA: oligoendopeptidase F [Roseiflexaceae bacterium]|nr:oligoendopeptidase F [Roseiflexaceae bacterium]HMP41710.1 oligoendopeptidase F [Roseiflexaceae bacterium]